MITAPLAALAFALVPLLQIPGQAPERQACALDVLTPTALDERAVRHFEDAIARYVQLHRRLERSLPPEQMFDDPEDMWAAREALASALVDARPLARQGNIFTPGIAAMIRGRLQTAIVRRQHDPADVLAAIDEERLPGMPEPEVNRPYPWGIGSAMWPTLLDALPGLPPELEYRFSHRSLVLIDVHANLVVDVLDEALPAAGWVPEATADEAERY